MLRGKLSLFIHLFPLAIAASAQAQATHESFPSRGDVYFGGAFTGSNPSVANNGFGGGADFRVLGPIHAAGEVNAYFGSSGINNVTLVDYLFGPRFSTPWRRHSKSAIFADFLFGGQTLHNSSSDHAYYYGNGSGYANAGDVGADIGLTRRLAIRAQFGYVYGEFAAGNTNEGNFRWTTAAKLVYRF